MVGVRVVGALVALLLSLGTSARAAPGETGEQPRLSITSWSLDGPRLEVAWHVSPELADEVEIFWLYGDVDYALAADDSFDGATRAGVLDLGEPPAPESRVSVSVMAGMASGETVQVTAVVQEGEEPQLTYEAISHSGEDELELRWTLPSSPWEGEAIGYEIELMMSSVPPGQEETSFHQTIEPVLRVPFPYGRSFGYFYVRPMTADGPGRWSDRLTFYYEDVLPAPTNLSLHPRAGGFHVGWRFNEQAGEPQSWLVSLDGEPIDVEVTRYQFGRKALVLGLEPDSEHTITVQSVGGDGPGLPATATARTAAGPSTMPAPTVAAGPRGGPLSVVVSWSTPSWGGGSPCCFRITAVGRSASGQRVTVQRFADADLRRLDFAVGAVGPWRFSIEAKTGSGFSPPSAASAKVRAA